MHTHAGGPGSVPEKAHTVGPGSVPGCTIHVGGSECKIHTGGSGSVPDTRFTLVDQSARSTLVDQALCLYARSTLVDQSARPTLVDQALCLNALSTLVDRSARSTLVDRLNARSTLADQSARSALADRGLCPPLSLTLTPAVIPKATLVAQALRLPPILTRTSVQIPLLQVLPTSFRAGRPSLARPFPQALHATPPGHSGTVHSPLLWRPPAQGQPTP
jgi:hypothetical protein